MGNRLTKIVTRTGDSGSTGLGNGTRVAKDCMRIECVGVIDELNSCLGMLLAETLPEEASEILLTVQNDLFDLGGELTIPGSNVMTERHVLMLEEKVQFFNDHLEPLKEFILPGGTRAAASAHLTRTVCRRAERRLITLHNDEPVPEMTMKYINRLSDLLFVLGRWLNKMAGETDILWVAAHKRQEK